MRTVAILLAALACAGPAAAQQKPGPPPTAAELQRATDTLSVFVSALNSKDVLPPTKAGLLMCLYDNPLGEIAEKSAKVFAANKTADPKSPSQQLFVLVNLCHAPGMKAGR